MMRYDQYEYLLYSNIVLHDYKAIYFFIPKVACTSLKKAMGQILGIEKGIPPPSHGSHRQALASGRKLNEPNYHFYHYPFVTDATRFDDYFKFCFVRNPWDRLVSCYFDKVKGDFPDFRKYGFSSKMSFRDFALAIGDIEDKKADSHFRSQHKIILAAGNVSMNFVGRFENLEFDFAQLCERIRVRGVSLERLKKSSRPKNTYTEHYTQDLAVIVGNRYKGDIEMFSYGFGN